MTRLFVDFYVKDNITLSGEDARYISKVLRMKTGEEIDIVDKDSKTYRTRISSINTDEVFLEVESEIEESGEPRSRITLYQSVSKGERMDLTIQKSVELGVFRIVPVISERVIVKGDSINDNKIKRWSKIALEAARQSRRSIVPEVTEAKSFKDALKEAEAYDLAIIPWEDEKGTTIKEIIKDREFKDIAVFIGPEGGFEEAEAKAAGDMGIIPVSLGPRILRTETAGPAVLAMLTYEEL